MLMYDGLAENILIEVSHHWTRRLMNDDGDEENNLGTNEDELKRSLLLIRSACVTTGDEEKNQTVQEMLEKFNVGTEKGKKIILPPRDPKLLGPLRKQSLESVRNKAKRNIIVREALAPADRIDDNNGEIQQQQQSIAPAQSPLPIVDVLAYQNILKCVHVIVNSCRSSDPSFLSETIGYKLVEQRAAPFDSKQPGDVTSIKQKLRKLFLIANENDVSSVRVCKTQNKTKTDLQDNLQQQSLDCTSTTPNVDNNDDESSICTSSTALKETPMNRIIEKPVSTKHHSCCCCCLTNRIRTDLKVPLTKQKEIKENDNNQVRQTYFKGLFQSKEYLRRLGLKTNDKRKGLEICSDHEMEKALLDFLWVDNNGKKQTSTAYFNLPQDPSSKPLSLCKTKAETTKRQPADPRRKRKPQCQTVSNTKMKITRKVCNFKNCCNKWYNNKSDVVDIRFQKIPIRPPTLLFEDRQKHRNYFLMTHDIKSFFSNKPCHESDWTTNVTKEKTFEFVINIESKR